MTWVVSGETLNARIWQGTS